MGKNLPIDDIIKLYTVEELKLTTIAKMYDVHQDTIKYHLKKNNIKIDTRRQYDKRERVYKRKDYPKCSVENCMNQSTIEYNNVFYCRRHHAQIIYYGKILKRTKFDKNEIRKYDDYCEMDLYDSKHNIKGICIFDIDKFDYVSKYKWLMDKQGYIVRKDAVTNERITMHRELMGLNKSNNKTHLVDHINLNKSDNRLSNLRIADDSKNEMNKNLSPLNNSGVKGVCFYNTKGCWSAEIAMNKIKRRESFKYFDDAVRQRIIWEALDAKEFSPNYNHFTQTIQLTYHSHDDNLQTFIESDLQGNILTHHKLPQ